LVKKKAANAFEALLPAANLPEPKSIQFIVMERDEFDKYVKTQTQMYGGQGKIEGEGDQRIHTLNFNLQNNGEDEENPRFPVYRQFFRYANGVVYQSDFEELFTMDLPSAKELKIDPKRSEWDIYAEIDPTAISKRTRGMAWQIVRLATQTALQQFDNEDDTSYFARRSSGEFQLNLLESMILDTDSVRVGLKYATDDEPIRLRVEIDARNRSNLAKHFGNMSRGDKRLASLRDRPSAITFATSWSIPDAGKKMVDGFFKLGRLQLEELLGTNFEAMIAVDDLFKMFAKSLEDGSGDMVIKLARTDNEFAIFGGMKLVDAERVGKGLELLLRTLPEIDGSGVRNSVDKDGRRYLSFLTEDIPFRVVKDSIDKVPGRLHFCVADETLWFCLGGNDSLETLEDIVKKASDSVNKPRRESVQFLIDLSLNRWLADDDTADGFSRLPHLALESGERMIHNWFLGTMQGARAQVEEVQDTVVELKQDGKNGVAKDGKNGIEKTERVQFTMPAFTAEFKESYLEKLLTKKQSGVRIELNATPKQIRLEVSVGVGLTKILIARVMSAQMSMMENMQKNADTTHA
jgi:hypothetical protein